MISEADLEEFESFSLQSFRWQSGERCTETLFTEAQGLALPQHGLWEVQKKERVYVSTYIDRAKMEFHSCKLENS